jgi:hypothetical protein
MGENTADWWDSFGEVGQEVEHKEAGDRYTIERINRGKVTLVEPGMDLFDAISLFMDGPPGKRADIDRGSIEYIVSNYHPVVDE